MNSSPSAEHPTSVKYADPRLLSRSGLSPTNVDLSGPLTPDTVVLVNPFTSEHPSSSAVLSALRRIGDYELSETKFDDFKCARHVPSGEALLYKEYPLASVRQRLEPYRRLTSLLLAPHVNKQLSVSQLAARSHLHFFRDILSFEQTAIVLYPSYTGNLHTYITEKHRLNENESRDLFGQIVRAIQLCHRAGLIIRDLKLRKLIFTNSTHSQLLLTGLEDAILLPSPTATDDFVSSRFSCPVYACPEIVLNRQMYSGKMADAWSLGIILYTMLFGRYPFCDRTLVGLFIKIGRCRPEIPRTISFKARSLLRSLIRAKPHERLSAEDMLGHVWFNGVGERETSLLGSSSNVNEDSSSLSSSNKPSQEDAVVPNVVVAVECE